MKANFLLVGEIIVDVLQFSSGPTVQLGGIFHAARTFAALGFEVTLAYVAPEYLERHIQEMSNSLGIRHLHCIGTVNGCPNLVLVGEVTEAGDQGYEFLLEKERQVVFHKEQFRKVLAASEFTDALIFPDNNWILPLLKELRQYRARVHIDANFEKSFTGWKSAYGRPIATVILSSSSVIFQKTCNQTPSKACTLALRVGETFVFKENRGGTRFWTKKKNKPLNVPAFVTEARHSVGVGDCFDVTFLCFKPKLGEHAALRMAALIAQSYAATSLFEVFKAEAMRSINIPQKQLLALQGITLPWEERKKINIYIAAPDFQGVDSQLIDVLANALQYHNFTPHRPVKEHGEINSNSSLAQRAETAAADITLLHKCAILVAVPLYADPGTYIEIGYALALGKPVIMYAPKGMPKNLLAEELPNLVARTLDQVIAEVFKWAQQRKNP